MYGGGVKAGLVDCAMPIRASALRGQLRFWWRLLYGGDRPSADVFKEECAIWGGITAEGPHASQVVVRVACPVVEDDQLIDGKPPDVADYALILDPKEKPPRLLKQEYSFHVTLEFRSDGKREQVVEALRWWASFSGVGARTRRGLGAVKVPAAEVKPVQKEEVDKLGGRMVLGPARPSAMAAWSSAMDPLRRFRQVGLGRGSGRSPGRSNWPEADTIRRVAGKSAHDPRHPVDGYPRAAFGLPIVFHFKDDGDPSDVLEAAGEGQDRMASPLILRPYFDGQKHRPMALLLPGWQDRVGVMVALETSGRAAKAWPDDAGERKRLAQKIAPMKDRGDDALSAFMHYFEEQMEGRRDSRRRK